MQSFNNQPVLVVDDSATMRKLLHGMLTSIGFRTIHEAAEGSAALAKVQSNSFALIISDWHMEPMDGMTFLKEVRRTSRPGVNRFIFMTTERTWGAKTSAKIEGAEAFLPKPFDQKTLRATIEKVLV